MRIRNPDENTNICHVMMVTCLTNILIQHTYLNDIDCSRQRVDLTNENADRVSRDLLGLELGEVGGALLWSPVSMQANTAANIKSQIFTVRHLCKLPTGTYSITVRFVREPFPTAGLLPLAAN
jgi:hypothetical protein